MSDRIRFYLDEHIPGAISRALKRHNIDVLSTARAGMSASGDADQLQFATSERRVLVTFDVDFLSLHRAGVPHAGIAWCPEQKYSVGELIEALLLLHGFLTPDEMRGHIEHL